MAKASPEQIANIKRDAERNVPSAQYLLGWMYYCGKDMPRNYEEAARWILRSADLGNVMAQTVLINIYRRGRGVKQSAFEAAKWAMRAAESGNVQAQAEIGKFYLSGYGVEKNIILAYVWLSIARMFGNMAWNHRFMCFSTKLGLKREEVQKASKIINEWLNDRMRKLAS